MFNPLDVMKFRTPVYPVMPRRFIKRKRKFPNLPGRKYPIGLHGLGQDESTGWDLFSSDSQISPEPSIVTGETSETTGWDLFSSYTPSESTQLSIWDKSIQEIRQAGITVAKTLASAVFSKLASNPNYVLTPSGATIPANSLLTPSQIAQYQTSPSTSTGTTITNFINQNLDKILIFGGIALVGSLMFRKTISWSHSKR